jgi:hypothetical protein
VALSETASHTRDIDEIWHWYLTGQFRAGLSSRQLFELRLEQTIYGVLPGAPRCIECHVPLAGVGGFIVSLLGVGPSSL